MVSRTVLRLSAGADPVTGRPGDPVVRVGAAEYTLHEAEVLLAALTQLVDQGQASLAAEEAEGALPVTDA